MTDLIVFLVTGLAFGSVYALAASGLVLTYSTSGIFNFAHGAFAMLGAFIYWQMTEGWGWPSPPPACMGASYLRRSAHPAPRASSPSVASVLKRQAGRLASTDTPYWSRSRRVPSPPCH